jgi:hypothetical protein
MKLPETLPFRVLNEIRGNDGDGNYVLFEVDEDMVKAADEIRHMLAAAPPGSRLRMEQFCFVDSVILKDVPEGMLRTLDGEDAAEAICSHALVVCEEPPAESLEELRAEGLRTECDRLRVDSYGEVAVAFYQKHCDNLLITDHLEMLMRRWFTPVEGPNAEMEELCVPASEKASNDAWRATATRYAELEKTEAAREALLKADLSEALKSEPYMLIPVEVWQHTVAALADRVHTADYLTPEEYDDDGHAEASQEVDRWARAVLELAESFELPDTSPEGMVYRKRVLELAREQCDGVEVDSKSVVSNGDDNGCYVSAWSWVSFKGTDLDKDDE